MWKGMGGGLVGVDVGIGMGVPVGGGVAVTAVGVGDEPPNEDRQAVRETMSNIKMMVFFCMVPFPFHVSLPVLPFAARRRSAQAHVRAAGTWRLGNLLMPKTLRFL
jgi:hypothetical protein